MVHKLDDERIAVTDSGYTNGSSYSMYHHSTNEDAHRLLACGRHRPYTIFEFPKYCEENNIICFFSPAPMSRILQLLDVGMFYIYKPWHI